MAIIFIDGFDWFPNNLPDEGAGRWVMAGTASRYDRLTTTRNGHGASIRLEVSADMSTTVPVTPDTFYVAFAFRIGSTTTLPKALVSFTEAGVATHLQIYVNADLTLGIRRLTTSLANGTTVLAINTWYHISFKAFIDNTTGTYELRLNGGTIAEISGTGADTQNGGTGYVNQITLRGESANFEFDDFVFADDTGGQTFLGDMDVYTVHPDGAGASAQFTPSAGSNWQNVDENPNDGDTTYNESSTAAHKDRFTMGDVPADTDTIYGVQVSAFAKKTDVGTREIKTVAFDGTTEGSGATFPLTTDFTWTWDMYEDHPSGAAAWTESEVNSMQAGYEVVT